MHTYSTSEYFEKYKLFIAQQPFLKDKAWSLNTSHQPKMQVKAKQSRYFIG